MTPTDPHIFCTIHCSAKESAMTHAVISTTSDALDIHCPSCGAAPGQNCVSLSSGEYADFPHLNRRRVIAMMPMTPAAVARHTLWWFGRGGQDGGGFVTALLNLISVSDLENRAHLQTVEDFAPYVQAYELGSNTPEGITFLLARAQDDQ